MEEDVIKNDEADTEDGYYTADGWWIDSSDDIYDEKYGDLDPLEETYSSGDILSPFKLVLTSVLYQPETSKPNADGTKFKERPALLLVDSEDGVGYHGFQITSKPSKKSKYRTKFRCKLSNPAQYSLELDPSYINYDHFVFIRDNYVKVNFHTSLSKTDCRTLYDSLKADWNTLVPLQSRKRQKTYNRLIKLLEAYLDIDEEDSNAVELETAEIVDEFPDLEVVEIED